VFSGLREGQFPSTYENHWVAKDGSKRFIAWTNTVTTDDNGDVDRVVATGIDITERIREEQDKVRRLETELERLEDFASAGSTRVTGRTFSQSPLHERAPEEFDRLCRGYEEILKSGLEERAYKTEGRASGELQKLAAALGLADAGPKDVVELHVAALRTITRGVSEKRARALNEEARLLALELMGYLVTVYRNRSLGSNEVADE
jgi:hypothetical protein